MLLSKTVSTFTSFEPDYPDPVGNLLGSDPKRSGKNLEIRRDPDPDPYAFLQLAGA